MIVTGHWDAHTLRMMLAWNYPFALYARAGAAILKRVH